MDAMKVAVLVAIAVALASVRVVKVAFARSGLQEPARLMLSPKALAQYICTVLSEKWPTGAAVTVSPALMPVHFTTRQDGPSVLVFTQVAFTVAMVSPLTWPLRP